MNVTTGKIIRYTLLPEFLPRLRDIFSSGFFHIAFLLATIFQAARLLSYDHDYLKPENFCKYGIRHVMAEAGRNLTWDRNHLDQIVIYMVMLIGLILLAVQIFMVVAALVTQAAIASTPGFADMFKSPDETHDMVFMILDHVFGVKGIFNSCVSQVGVDCVDMNNRKVDTPEIYPFPIHIAFHQMLRFYSMGILFIAVIVIIYYVATIVAETATTGVPFGKRFNKAWAVPRILLFFALLAPLNIGDRVNGMNSAQLLTLLTAKWGSNLATNGWILFNEELPIAYLGSAKDGGVKGLIAKPSPPEIGSLMQFMFVARTCSLAEKVVNDKTVQPYIVRSLVKENESNHIPWEEFPDYEELLKFTDKGMVILRFGERSAEKYGNYKGYVEPTCGEIHLNAENFAEPGGLSMEADYYALMIGLWASDEFSDYAQCVVKYTVPEAEGKLQCPAGLGKARELFLGSKQYFEEFIIDRVAENIEIQEEEGVFMLPEFVKRRGWGAAAVWFNRIADMNGAITGAVLNIPRPYVYPLVMEKIANERRSNNESAQGSDLFNPIIRDQKSGTLRTASVLPGELAVAKGTYRAYRLWMGDETDDNVLSRGPTRQTSNVLENLVSTIFGVSGLFTLRDEEPVHPMAMLTSIGKSMIQATVRNALVALGGVVGEGLGSLISSNFFKDLSKTVGGFAVTFLSVTLVLGFILFYILPFMPFIYFFFALAGWIKSIFEAVVAMPLWALAHLRIDGEGLPGPGATNGYFLLLEILLRPILMLFGLLASLQLFSALSITIFDVFDQVAQNLAGYNYEEIKDDPTEIEFYRNYLDQFFFTLVYVVLIYMVGLSSFKLIDLIPKGILRWMGITTPTFQENAGDPAGQLMQYVYKGSTVTAAQLSGGIGGGQLQGLLQK